MNAKVYFANRAQAVTGNDVCKAVPMKRKREIVNDVASSNNRGQIVYIKRISPLMAILVPRKVHYGVAAEMAATKKT